jgi:hypothetical protein
MGSHQDRGVPCGASERFGTTTSSQCSRTDPNGNSVQRRLRRHEDNAPDEHCHIVLVELDGIGILAEGLES